jgi:predicted metal-dependent HD superfamily phosphohydrolase
VRLTATHDPARGDRNGETLCDADLAILAASTDRYRTYASAVRAEYARVPDDAFRTARAHILRALIDGGSLYRTPYAQQHWETAARTNLTTELHNLKFEATKSRCSE